MQLNDKDAQKQTTLNPFPSPETIKVNVMEGTVGERGEIYVGLQFAMVFLVIIAPAFQVSLSRSLALSLSRSLYATNMQHALTTTTIPV
jgi:hypothetical protein